MACTACGSLLEGIYKHAPMTREHIDESRNRNREIVIMTDDSDSLFPTNPPSSIVDLINFLHNDVIADPLKFIPTFEMKTTNSDDPSDSDRRHLVTWEAVYAMQDSLGGLKYLIDGGIQPDGTNLERTGALRSFDGSGSANKGNPGTGCITNIGNEGLFSVTLGLNTTNTGDYSSILGGDNHYIIYVDTNAKAEKSTILGGGGNTIHGSDFGIVGGTNNYINNAYLSINELNPDPSTGSHHCTILNGNNNKIDAMGYSSIMNGTDNEIYDTFRPNTTDMDWGLSYNSILNGKINKILSSYSSMSSHSSDSLISATFNSAIESSRYVTITGSYFNRIISSETSGIYTGFPKENVISTNPSPFAGGHSLLIGVSDSSIYQNPLLGTGGGNSIINSERVYLAKSAISSIMNSNQSFINFSQKSIILNSFESKIDGYQSIYFSDNNLIEIDNDDKLKITTTSNHGLSIGISYAVLIKRGNSQATQSNVFGFWDCVVTDANTLISNSIISEMYPLIEANGNYFDIIVYPHDYFYSNLWNSYRQHNTIFSSDCSEILNSFNSSILSSYGGNPDELYIRNSHHCGILFSRSNVGSHTYIQNSNGSSIISSHDSYIDAQPMSIGSEIIAYSHIIGSRFSYINSNNTDVRRNSIIAFSENSAFINSGDSTTIGSTGISVLDAYRTRVVFSDYINITGVSRSNSIISSYLSNINGYVNESILLNAHRTTILGDNSTKNITSTSVLDSEYVYIQNAIFCDVTKSRNVKISESIASFIDYSYGNDIDPEEYSDQTQYNSTYINSATNSGIFRSSSSYITSGAVDAFIFNSGTSYINGGASNFILSSINSNVGGGVRLIVSESDNSYISSGVSHNIIGSKSSYILSGAIDNIMASSSSSISTSNECNIIAASGSYIYHATVSSIIGSDNAWTSNTYSTLSLPQCHIHASSSSYINSTIDKETISANNFVPSTHRATIIASYSSYISNSTQSNITATHHSSILGFADFSSIQSSQFSHINQSNKSSIIGSYSCQIIGGQYIVQSPNDPINISDENHIIASVASQLNYTSSCRIIGSRSSAIIDSSYSGGVINSRWNSIVSSVGSQIDNSRESLIIGGGFNYIFDSVNRHFSTIIGGKSGHISNSSQSTIIGGVGTFISDSLSSSIIACEKTGGIPNEKFSLPVLDDASTPQIRNAAYSVLIGSIGSAISGNAYLTNAQNCVVIGSSYAYISESTGSMILSSNANDTSLRDSIDQSYYSTLLGNKLVSILRGYSSHIEYSTDSSIWDGEFNVVSGSHQSSILNSKYNLISSSSESDILEYSERSSIISSTDSVIENSQRSTIISVVNGTITNGFNQSIIGGQSNAISTNETGNQLSRIIDVTTTSPGFGTMEIKNLSSLIPTVELINIDDDVTIGSVTTLSNLSATYSVGDVIILSPYQQYSTPANQIPVGLVPNYKYVVKTVIADSITVGLDLSMYAQKSNIIAGAEQASIHSGKYNSIIGGLHNKINSVTARLQSTNPIVITGGVATLYIDDGDFLSPDLIPDDTYSLTVYETSSILVDSTDRGASTNDTNIYNITGTPNNTDITITSFGTSPSIYYTIGTSLSDATIPGSFIVVFRKVDNFSGSTSSSIYGGSFNSVYRDDRNSAILSGKYNKISLSESSSIICGTRNQMGGFAYVEGPPATYTTLINSSILGGEENTIENARNVSIINGYRNQIGNGITTSNITGGVLNTIKFSTTVTSFNTFYVDGNLDANQIPADVIVGGKGHTIYISTDSQSNRNAIMGGTEHYIAVSRNSIILGGSGNYIGRDDDAIGSRGFCNNCSILGGTNNYIEPLSVGSINQCTIVGQNSYIKSNGLSHVILIGNSIHVDQTMSIDGDILIGSGINNTNHSSGFGGVVVNALKVTDNRVMIGGLKYEFPITAPSTGQYLKCASISGDTYILEWGS